MMIMMNTVVICVMKILIKRTILAATETTLSAEETTLSATSIPTVAATALAVVMVATLTTATITLTATVTDLIAHAPRRTTPIDTAWRTTTMKRGCGKGWR